MDQLEYNGLMGHMMRANAAEQQRRKDANDIDALVALVREGIRSAWAASPNAFPNRFDLDAAAVAAVRVILGGQ